MKSIK